MAENDPATQEQPAEFFMTVSRARSTINRIRMNGRMHDTLFAGAYGKDLRGATAEADELDKCIDELVRWRNENFLQDGVTAPKGDTSGEVPF